MHNLEKILDIDRNIVKGTNEIIKNLTTITIYNGPLSFNVDQDIVRANPWGYADAIRKLSSLIDSLNIEMTKVLAHQMNKVKDLLVLENNILNSLSDIEVNKYLKMLDSLSNKYDEEVIDRVREKLMVRSYILMGISIDGDKILKSSFLDNYKFYSREVIPCIINIEVFKKLKNNIKALNGSLSFWFIRGLYALYEKKKFDTMKDNALMELILFNYNTDVEKTPEIEIDFDSVMSTIPCNDEDYEEEYDDDELNDNLDDDEDYEEDYNDYIMYKALEAIDIIRSIDPFNNDVDEVFDLLYNFTLFEVLISYLNIDDLEEIKSYCKEIINTMNKPCIKLIRKMIDVSEKN